MVLLAWSIWPKATWTQTSSSVSGNCPEQPGDVLQPAGEEFVHAVFDRFGVAHIVDIDDRLDLPDALDATLALF